MGQEYSLPQTGLGCVVRSSILVYVLNQEMTFVDEPSSLPRSFYFSFRSRISTVHWVQYKESLKKLYL